MPKELLTAMFKQAPHLICGHGPPTCHRIGEHRVARRVDVDSSHASAPRMATAGAGRFQASNLVLGTNCGTRTSTPGGQEPITCPARFT
ncbi:hypothetical protein [Streptosporangium sp. H16]|uniref:hypothetical protein n=1 Tax=Streptosporangium sp. H16 TaxID=3444184 RepID=UPI003F7A7635